jgi:predicted  nucleic acid-binding Zn-ribbon protein
MIEWLMFGALGFLLGCLLALMLAPPLWNRAVKLTTRRLEATMPMSLNDIQADKDQLRAEFAIELRKVEVALDKAREKATRELIEANKRRVEIAVLNTELASAKSHLQENENANRVLQQTIKRRLPDLDSRLKAAKKALAELESVNVELRSTVASQSDALKTARTTLHNQRSDIERLRIALESGSGATLRGAQENTLLRRELTRLASQILAVARAQGPVQAQQRVVEVRQTYSEFSSIGEEAEPAWQPAHPAQAGNGGAREPEMAEAAHEVDTMTAGMSPGAELAVQPADRIEREGDSEAEEPKGPLAKRFAARRERRRTRKTEGKSGSLSDRLKGLVIDRAET